MPTPPSPHLIHAINPSTHPQFIAPLLSLLRPYLPLSLPLYRRIQFAHSTPVTRLLLSFPPDVLLASPALAPPKPWLAAHSDPSRGPETQIFMFGSWEVAGPRLPTEGRGDEGAGHGKGEGEGQGEGEGMPERDEAVRELMKGFVRYVRDEGMYNSVQTGTENPRGTTSGSGPGSGHGLGSDTTTGAETGKGKHHALLGAVHESTARILYSFGILDPEFVDGRKGGDGLPERYSKWIFDLRGCFGEGAMGSEGVERVPDENMETGVDMSVRQGAKGARGKKFSVEDTLLPVGLVWGEVKERDYPLVRSRTGIPRQDRTLRILPSVAIYLAGQEEGPPVAWTFLGVDSSLTTLHVEEEYRGRGLAKKLALKVWCEHLGWYVRQYTRGMEREERWAHADVAISNAPSNGVCKSLGGYTEWADYWFRADLNALQDTADNE